jgi:hypothetical protein
MQILRAKNGSPVLFHEKNWLHSPYNPEAEAEKYVASLGLSEGITHFILIECALGYIIPALKQKFPGAVIISLHCERSLCGLAESFQADFELFPETPLTIRHKLEQEIPENARLKIIEWRPSLAVYPQKYLALLETAVDFLKFHIINQRTAAYFEKRWQKNSERNVTIFKYVVYPKNPSRSSFPVVVTAAGPGLMSCLPELKKKQNNVYIIAVSSSLSALCEHGIKPDMIVTTDGGFWALPHLHEIKRYFTGAYPVIAAALTASIPSFLHDAPFLPLSDGSNAQNARLSALHIPFVSLPQRGTVSATALDLAFLLTRGPVYLTGLDLSDKDVVSHASPYAFEPFFRTQANRFTPYFHQLYARSRLNAEAHTQAVYTAWFKNNLAQYASRLLALGSNHPLFDPMRTDAIAEMKQKGAPDFQTLRITQ